MDVEIVTNPYPIPGHPVPGMHIYGLVGPGELLWLRKMAAGMETIVEVGSLHGRSAYAMATATEGKVYCIDPWEDSLSYLYNSPPGSMYGEFKANTKGIKNIISLHCESPDCGFLVPDPVDMVWIDGDHHEAAVLADISYWHMRVRKIICGHDYGNPICPGVKKSVDAYFRPKGIRVETVLPGAPIWYVEV